MSRERLVSVLIPRLNRPASRAPERNVTLKREDVKQEVHHGNDERQTQKPQGRLCMGANRSRDLHIVVPLNHTTPTRKKSNDVVRVLVRRAQALLRRNALIEELHELPCACRTRK